MYCRFAQGLTALLHIIYLAFTLIFLHTVTHKHSRISYFFKKIFTFLFLYLDMSRKFSSSLSNGDGAIFEGQGFSNFWMKLEFFISIGTLKTLM